MDNNQADSLDITDILTTSPISNEQGMLISQRSVALSDPWPIVITEAEDITVSVVQQEYQNGLDESLELTLDYSHLTIQPGRSITLSGIVGNHGHQIERVTLQVRGIPDDWIRDLPFPMVLGVKQEQVFTLVITPPKTPESKADQYEITIIAMSKVHPNRLAKAQLTLTVLPYYEFSSDLWPDHVRSRRSVQIEIRNKGNSPQTYLIRGKDIFNELAIIPSHQQVRLQPEQVGKTAFQIRVRRPPWIGPQKDYPFSLQVVPVHGDIQEHTGVIMSEPLISGGLALMALMLLCLIPAAIIFTRGEGNLGSAIAQVAQDPIISTVPAAPASQGAGDRNLTALNPVITAPLVISQTNIISSEDSVPELTSEPKLEFNTPEPDRVIISGESVTLKWKAEGIENVFLNGEQVTGMEEKTYRPDATTTYTLTGTLPDGNTPIESEPIEILVARKETITFDTFPNGVYIKPGFIFQGDEFSAKGVEFTIESDLFNKKNTNSCDSKNVRKPAIGVAIDYVGTPYLTTFVPRVVPRCETCEATYCKSVPISINFRSPVQGVTVTFLHPSGSAQVHLMRRADNQVIRQADNQEVATASDEDQSEREDSPSQAPPYTIKEAPRHLRFWTTFSEPDIVRVDIGMDQDQPPEITKIEYWYVPKEEKGQ